MPQKCPKCGSNKLSTAQTKTRNITDRKVTIEVTPTSHTIHTCTCIECGRKGITPDMTGIIPNKGSYGNGVIADVLALYESRMPVKMISRNRKRDIGINISAGAICNIISSAGSRLTKPAKQILASLIMTKILHIDETSYSVNGKLYWVWIILNPDTGEAYFDIRNSRGTDVLRELLPGWNGTIVCDGWSPYGMFEKMQRCWAHIIREARHISERNPDNAGARQVHKLLRRVFHDAKRKRRAGDRQKDHLLFTLRIKRLLSKYGDNPILESFMTKLQNAL